MYPPSVPSVISSPSNTTSSYEPHLSSVSSTISSLSSFSTSSTVAEVSECSGCGRFERQPTVVEHRTWLLLLLLCGEAQFIITEKELSVTASFLTDLLLLCPHSGVVEPLSSVVGEIRLWQTWNRFLNWTWVFFCIQRFFVLWTWFNLTW